MLLLGVLTISCENDCDYDNYYDIGETIYLKPDSIPLKVKEATVWCDYSIYITDSMIVHSDSIH